MVVVCRPRGGNGLWYNRVTDPHGAQRNSHTRPLDHSGHSRGRSSRPPLSRLPPVTVGRESAAGRSDTLLFRSGSPQRRRLHGRGPWQTAQIRGLEDVLHKDSARAKRKLSHHCLSLYTSWSWRVARGARVMHGNTDENTDFHLASAVWARPPSRTS